MISDVRAELLGRDVETLRRAGIAACLFVGGVTADFTPLSIYLSLHVSDVLLIAAGVLALPCRPDRLPKAALRFLRANSLIAAIALLGAMFLAGTAISTAIAAARGPTPGQDAAVAAVRGWENPRNGIENPGFDATLDGWHGNLATLRRTTESSHSGSYSAVVLPAGTTAGAGIHGSLVPASPGSTYELSVWLRARRPVVVEVRIDWYGFGAYISSATRRIRLSTAFTRAAVVGTAPRDTTRAQPVVYTVTRGARGFNVDTVRLRATALGARSGIYSSDEAVAAVLPNTRQGVETWLLFAMLIGLLAPSVAVAIARYPETMVALAAGLAAGAVVGGLGYLGKAATTGESFFYGQRPSGVLGSDPLLLMMVGLAILVAHSLFIVRREPRSAIRWGVFLAESLAAVAIVAGIAVSRYRAGWIATTAMFFFVVAAATKSVRATAVAAVAAASLCGAAYVLGALPEPLVERFEQTFSRDQPDVEARAETTRQLLTVWSEQPWGIGLGESARYLSPDLIEGRNPSLHNVVGHALVEGGPLAALGIGLLPFALGILWWRSRRNASNDWRDVWPAGAVLAVFLSAQFGPTLYHHAAWASAGALVGWAVNIREPRST